MMMDATIRVQFRSFLHRNGSKSEDKDFFDKPLIPNVIVASFYRNPTEGDSVQNY